MGRYLEYKNAKMLITAIGERPDKYVLIHYATSSFKDDDFPAIASISLMFYDNRERVQFSLAKYLKSNELDGKYAEIRLIEAFFDFVEPLTRYFTFVHWNMNGEYFGFEAIENRYRILTGNERGTLKQLKKIDLDNVLSDLYSNSYVSDPKMYTLQELNKLNIKNFSKGRQEADWYNEKEWSKIAKASTAKVDFIYDVLRRTNQKTLEVNNRFNNQRLIFQDRLQYFINETLLGRFLFWLLVTIFGAVIGQLV